MRSIEPAAGRMIPYLTALALGLLVLDFTCFVALKICATQSVGLDQPAAATGMH